MSWISILLLALLGILVLLLLIMIIKALLTKPAASAKTAPSSLRVTSEEVAENLSKMIQVETISYPDQGVEEKYATMRAVLEDLFPEIFAACEKDILAGNGILLRWPGKDSKKQPYLFMSHNDVVPVEGEWKHPPFSGVIEDGRVYGRGTSDTKGSLSVILSACNHLAKSGFVPGRDIYILSTSSEEVSGPDAPEAVKLLKERGIRLDLVMDEGGALVSDFVPGLQMELAGIGLCEKGRVNVEFTAEGAGGHASSPPKRTPLRALGEFMVSVEKKSPFEYRLIPIMREMLATIAPYMSFPLKLVLANLWITAPLVKAVMKRIPQTRTFLATSCSFTMAQGSDAYNVLPKKASVIANMRISPHEGLEHSMAAIEKRAKKYGLKMRIINASDASPISTNKSEAYAAVCEAVTDVYPDVVPVSYLMFALTDSRHFHEICDTVLRFMPIRLTSDESKHIHSTDEYINIESLGTGAETLIRIIEQA